MEPAVVVFLVGAAFLVLALAVYLAVVAVRLRAVIATLDRVADGVDQMVRQTDPVGELVGRLLESVVSPTSSGDGHG